MIFKSKLIGSLIFLSCIHSAVEASQGIELEGQKISELIGSAVVVGKEFSINYHNGFINLSKYLKAAEDKSREAHGKNWFKLNDSDDKNLSWSLGRSSDGIQLVRVRKHDFGFTWFEIFVDFYLFKNGDGESLELLGTAALPGWVYDKIRPIKLNFNKIFSLSNGETILITDFSSFRSDPQSVFVKFNSANQITETQIINIGPEDARIENASGKDYLVVWGSKSSSREDIAEIRLNAKLIVMDTNLVLPNSGIWKDEFFYEYYFDREIKKFNLPTGYFGLVSQNNRKGYRLRIYHVVRGEVTEPLPLPNYHSSNLTGIDLNGGKIVVKYKYNSKGTENVFTLALR